MSSRVLLKTILAQDSFFMVNKELIKQFGLDESAIMSVLVDKEEYAYKHDQMKNDFFQCPLHYIEEKLNLGRRPIEDATKNLREAGLIDCKLFGCPAVKYYSINHEAVINIIADDESQFVQNEQTCLYETNKLDCPKSTTYKNNIDKNSTIKNNTPSDSNESSPNGGWPILRKRFSFIDEPYMDMMLLFYDNRKKLRKPMTEHAVRIAYNRLLDLSKGDVIVAAKIIDQSIEGSWTKLYELKNDNTRTQRQTAQRPVHPDRDAVLPALAGV